jgi:hypothetical protein
LVEHAPGWHSRILKLPSEPTSGQQQFSEKGSYSINEQFTENQLSKFEHSLFTRQSSVSRTIMMPQRTYTSDQNIIAVPDGRTYNFTDTAQSPHNIRITANSTYNFKSSRILGWHEDHGEVVTCVKGRLHTYKAFGMYSSVDSSFGVGSSDNFQRWTLYAWDRD